MKTKCKLDFKFAVRCLAFFLLASFAGGDALFAGSLWREAVTEERGMFSDKRARRVGDIITIIVNESIVGNTTLTRTTALNNEGTKAGLGTNLLNQFIAGITSRNRIPLTTSGSSGAYQSTFPSNLVPREGGGPPILTPDSAAFGNQNTEVLKQNQTLVSQIAVQVIDVLPNGNLVVEGLRQVSFGQERIFASLRGILRSYDVTAQNTIPSSLVADVRIDYIPEGQLAGSQRKGWLQRVDEKISPW